MNLITTLTKEIEKGNTVIRKNGEIMSYEKFAKQATKEYSQQVITGAIKDPTGADFGKYLESECIELDALLAEIQNAITDVSEINVIDMENGEAFTIADRETKEEK